MMHSRDARGFTLVELLVVIAVIGVLSSLLLPVLNRARQNSYSVYCLNNLRQWGLATQVFAVDNDDYLPKDGSPNGTPTAEGWYNDLPRGLGIPPYKDVPWRTNTELRPGRSIWICPANARVSNGNNLFHYCLNEHVNGRGAGNQVK